MNQIIQVLLLMVLKLQEIILFNMSAAPPPTHGLKDLGAVTIITSVTVFNRFDSCCQY
jgi:hypothetical protein